VGSVSGKRVRLALFEGSVSDLRCLRKLGSARRVLGDATYLRKFRKSDTRPHQTQTDTRPWIEWCTGWSGG